MFRAVLMQEDEDSALVYGAPILSDEAEMDSSVVNQYIERIRAARVSRGERRLRISHRRDHFFKPFLIKFQFVEGRNDRADSWK